MFLLQNMRNAALSWSPLDSDMMRLSSPAWETERLRLSPKRREAEAAAPAAVRSAAERLSFAVLALKEHTKISFTKEMRCRK